MPTPRIRIVHISDLHLGKESTQRWRMRRVLGRAWVDNLKAIADDGPVDLLCFTGDVAQSGKAEQYAQAQEFVHTALEILRLPPERFFCVPGNHDVDRSINKPEWESLRNAISAAGRGAAEGVSKWMDGGAVPFGFQAEWREAVLARQAAYQAWLGQIGRSALLPGPGLLGWRVSLDVGLATPLHLIGLDSAWLAGDDNDATKLLLTADQIGRLCTDEHGARLTGPLIALMHHPIDELADGREGRRLLAEHGVSLILHGHLHEPEHARWDTPSQGLHLSAAGCLYEGTKFPNSLQVLDLAMGPPHTLLPQQLWARAWSARGHWHDDDSLYPGSQNGRLLLTAPPATSLPLATDTFVGRQDQLKALKAALLPTHTQDTQAVVVCCAIEGMAGVGKTRLAEEFVTQHWLPHWGLPLEEGLAHHVVRLALSSEGVPPSTQDLAQTVADRLRLPGPTDTLFARVANGLSHGPQGKPRLLWLDNVDTQALADAVAPLRHHLKGCPLLVTARFQRLGSKEWQRVPVKPMEDEEALLMLQSQLDEQASSRIQPAEALALVRRLGGLPLALHIAASHLNLGHTPQSFIQALESHGLGLAPANADDPALLADHARAIIRHSFELSWRHWRDHQTLEWQNALVALAHGPAADVGASLAAAIAGVQDSAWQSLAPTAQRLSLLQIDATTQRVNLHPLIAEFLRSASSGPALEVQERLSNWFLSRLPETGDSKQGSAWSDVWLESAALSHWLKGLSPQQGLIVESKARHLASLQGPFGIWRAFLEHLLTGYIKDVERSDLYLTLAHLARRGGDPTAAIRYADRKVQIDHESGDLRGRALAFGVKADVFSDQGQLDAALMIHQQEELPIYLKLGSNPQADNSIAPAESLTQEDSPDKLFFSSTPPNSIQLANDRSAAITWGKIADIQETRGLIEEALKIRQFIELPAYQKLGDLRSIAVVQRKIAGILHLQGKLEDALRICIDLVLPVFESLGDKLSIAFTKRAIASMLTDTNFDESLRVLTEDVLPIYQQAGDILSEATTKAEIGALLAKQGKHSAALRIIEQEAIPVFSQIGDIRSLAIANGHRAEIYADYRKLDDALRIRLEEEIPALEQLGDIRSLALARAGIADILLLKGRYEDAMTLLKDKQLPVFVQLGDIEMLATTHEQIACAYQGQGEQDETIRIRYQRVLPIYKKLGMSRRVVVYQANLANALIHRGRLSDTARIAQLLREAHSLAVQLSLPEAMQVEEIFHKTFGVSLASSE